MQQLIKAALHGIMGRRRAKSLAALLRSYAVYSQRPVLLEPEPRPTLILAPHMDDEVLGCGGTIARHSQSGAEVSVVFLTDGRYGGDPSRTAVDADRELRLARLIETRKAEARRAAALLGVQNLAFLEAEDGRLRDDAAVAERLRTELEKRRPEVVYLPFLLENHVDHRAASEVLLRAAAASGLSFECRCYEVWTPLFPNMVVCIDDVLNLKREAMHCYASQLADMDYLHTCIGLNAYRSSAMGGRGGRHVEAFFSLPLEDYRRLHRALQPHL